MMVDSSKLLCSFFVLLRTSSVFSSPIVFPIDLTTLQVPFIPKDFCILPPDLGIQGTNKYLEECDGIDRYNYLPMPTTATQRVGVHPSVCCPKKINDDDICFPTDAWCPTFKPTEKPKLTQQVQVPTMANKTCYNTPLGNGMVLSNCVSINRCASLLQFPNAPVTAMQPCGFDEEEASLMICCPEELVTEPQKIYQEPRFSVGNTPGGPARACEDKHEMCKLWATNGGCVLNQTFVISDADANGVVNSADMFAFMQSACPESCGWCGSKGCVDEHQSCPQWVRDGMCVLNPFVMAHTCRESCGVCGFLSPTNAEEQVRDGKSYTDFTKDNFECGRYKRLTEINPEGFEVTTPNPCGDDAEVFDDTNTDVPNEPLKDDVDSDDFDLRQIDIDDIFLSSDGNKEDFFCGATMITDRWVIAASHCYDDFQIGATNAQRQVRINTIRDNTPYKELVEIKRIFKHPYYKFPNLYNDIALLELGRRVEYDYERYGDAPSCLDSGLELTEKTGTVQGYGLTETGKRGTLLEANVTIISNEKCQRTLIDNADDKITASAQKQINQALPYGLNYGLLCADGKKVKNQCGDDVFRGACKGDSGGPLTTKDDQGRTTLVGIVSGGIGCGDGIPGWYTKVRFHFKWVQCIIDKSKNLKNKIDIEKSCLEAVEEPKKCQEIEEDDLIFGDLRSIDEAKCNEDGTFASGTQFNLVVDPIFGDAVP